LWDTISGELLNLLTGHSASVIHATYSPDGQHIASASYDGTTKLWDANTGEEILTLYGHNSGVGDVAFSPDGKRLFTTGADGTSRTYILDIEELLKLAKDKLTRELTVEECSKYLYQEECPVVP
jgi:WD40 repeat protein